MTHHAAPELAPGNCTVDDVVIQWAVERERDTRSRVFRWFGTVHLADDELSSRRGHIEAYVLPEAGVSEATADDLDSLTQDLSMYMALCCSGRALDERIVEEYGDTVSSALVIIDRVVLDRGVRKRGIPRLMFSELVTALPSVALVACHPHPVAGEDDPELEGAAARKAQQRLAQHVQAHGFVPLPRSGGLHVARADDLMRDDET